MRRSTALIVMTIVLTACGDMTASARRANDVMRSSSSSSRSSSAQSASSRVVIQSSSSSSVSVPAQPRTEFSIPILVYHHIRDTKPWSPATWSWKMSVSPKKFEEQMQWLVDHGYTTISLDTLGDITTGKLYGPEKPVVITFDDNQLSAYDLAVPVMVARHQTATFYLIVKYIDNPDFIGRTQIPDLIAKGMDIQSHTMTHANLTNLSAKDLAWQLTESKHVLEEVTGRTVRHIAYPLTAHNATVRAATKAAGYVTGTIMDPRPVKPGADLFKLPRIMMTDTTDLAKTLP